MSIKSSIAWNFNQTTPEPLTFPQQSAGDIPSLFDNFDSERFKKHLSHMGAGWAMGNDFNESVQLGNLTASLASDCPTIK